VPRLSLVQGLWIGQGNVREEETYELSSWETPQKSPIELNWMRNISWFVFLLADFHHLNTTQSTAGFYVLLSLQTMYCLVLLGREPKNLIYTQASSTEANYLGKAEGNHASFWTLEPKMDAVTRVQAKGVDRMPSLMPSLKTTRIITSHRAVHINVCALPPLSCSHTYIWNSQKLLRLLHICLLLILRHFAQILGSQTSIQRGENNHHLNKIAHKKLCSHSH
jgi:hypothetical protein